MNDSNYDNLISLYKEELSRFRFLFLSSLGVCLFVFDQTTKSNVAVSWNLLLSAFLLLVAIAVSLAAVVGNHNAISDIRKRLFKSEEFNLAFPEKTSTITFRVAYWCFNLGAIGSVQHFVWWWLQSNVDKIV